jgi:glycerol kinase
MRKNPFDMSELDAEIDANEEQHHQVHIHARQSIDGERSLLQDEERRQDDLKDRFIGAIDQGTTSTRFIIFDCVGNPVAKYQAEYRQLHEHSGYNSHGFDWPAILSANVSSLA